MLSCSALEKKQKRAWLWPQMSLTYCRTSLIKAQEVTFSFPRRQPKSFVKSSHDLFARPLILAPSYDKFCACICILCCYLVSAWRRDVGGWVIAGNRDLSCCLNTVRRVPELRRRLCSCCCWALSEVTRWRLWFLFWHRSAGQHRPHDCHTVSKMFFIKCASIISSSCCHGLLKLSPAYWTCTGWPCGTSRRPLEKIMKRVVFPRNDDFTGICLEGRRVSDPSRSVYTRQTRNPFLAAPVFYWKLPLFSSAARHLQAACADRLVSPQ